MVLKSTLGERRQSMLCSVLVCAGVITLAHNDRIAQGYKAIKGYP